MNRNDQEPLSFSAASIRLSLLFLASPMLGITDAWHQPLPEGTQGTQRDHGQEADPDEIPDRRTWHARITSARIAMYVELGAKQCASRAAKR